MCVFACVYEYIRSTTCIHYKEYAERQHHNIETKWSGQTQSGTSPFPVSCMSWSVHFFLNLFIAILLVSFTIMKPDRHSISLKKDKFWRSCSTPDHFFLCALRLVTSPKKLSSTFVMRTRLKTEDNKELNEHFCTFSLNCEQCFSSHFYISARLTNEWNWTGLFEFCIEIVSSLCEL